MRSNTRPAKAITAAATAIGTMLEPSPSRFRLRGAAVAPALRVDTAPPPHRQDDHAEQAQQRDHRTDHDPTRREGELHLVLACGQRDRAEDAVAAQDRGLA